MPDTDRLLHLAVERGWITAEQARPGADLASLLRPEQIEQLRAGRKLASRVFESGLLKGETLADPAPLKFGRYTLIRGLGREIAIKILDRGVAAQPERFRREMGPAGASHPGPGSAAQEPLDLRGGGRSAAQRPDPVHRGRQVVADPVPRDADAGVISARSRGNA